MSFLKKVSNALFGSSGPKYSAQAGAAQNSGDTFSDLGNIIRTANADGSIDTMYESSDIDKARNSLASQGLGNISLGTYDPSNWYKAGSLLSDASSSYNPTQLYGNINQGTADNAAQSYYDQATRLLNKNFAQQQDKMDERLINRGIQTGTKQYNDTMGALADSYGGILNDLANQSVFQGQGLLSTMLGNQAQQTANEGAVFGNQGQLIANQGNQIGNESRVLANQGQELANAGQYYGNQGQQIGNVNALTGGRDINSLAGLNLQNSDAYNNAYQGSVYNEAMRNQRNQNIGSAIGSIAGGVAAGFRSSDKRLKENLKPVGKLHNGLKVYVGNYKKETGLDTTPQLFLLAQEVQKKHPEAVAKKMGALAVNYKKATE